MAEKTRRPLNLVNTFDTVNAQNQIQQVKAVGNQPRPTNLSPNMIAATNARALSTPGHVKNVQVSLVRASDVSSKVTVAFKRDPGDPYFSEAIVYVSGYKGNPQPARVASGQSPISFSLENTGEPVSVTVQANGNLGPAPISTAPNATLKLDKTPLATTPTTSGNGTGSSSLTMPAEFSVSQSGSAITVTKATETANTIWAGPISGAAATPTFRALDVADLPNFQSTAGQALWLPPQFILTWSTTAPTISPVANQVQWMRVILRETITIRKITMRCSSGSAGNTATCAIYDSAGTTKLIDAGASAFNVGAGNVTSSVTLGAAVTLTPGAYIFAWGCTGNTPTSAGGFVVTSAAGISGIINQNATRVGTAANGLSAAAMPASLGTLTGATTFDIPAIWFES